MRSSEGTEELLSDHLGKLTLLDFWAWGCGPCRQEHPRLVETYHRFREYGFNIVSVSEDTNQDRWLNAIEKDKVGAWLHVSDLKRTNKAALIYGTTFLPSNFLIDENGVIVEMDLCGAHLRAMEQRIAHVQATVG